VLSSFFDSFFTQYSYFELFGMTIGYFAFLYFGLGYLYWKMCRFLFKQGWMEKISDRPYSKEQLRFELRQSLYSIFVVGFSSFPLAYLIRNQVIQPGEGTLLNILLGLFLLTFWNEIHFYTIHRILHLPWLMKRVHSVHHRSVVPSVFSVYSFHPLEAFLLSSVLVCIAPFYPFPAAALMLFPTVSILINFSGHSNYRMVLHTKKKWLLFATKHNDHHGKAGKEYGFMTNFMDSLFTPEKSKEHSSTNQTDSSK
jgi:sterol desaturase/sphingolipid hydroxylase (fatty acid hydroxylase superfamily)